MDAEMVEEIVLTLADSNITRDTPLEVRERECIGMGEQGMPHELTLLATGLEINWNMPTPGDRELYISVPEPPEPKELIDMFLSSVDQAGIWK